MGSGEMVSAEGQPPAKKSRLDDGFSCFFFREGGAPVAGAPVWLLLIRIVVLHCVECRSCAVANRAGLHSIDLLALRIVKLVRIGSADDAAILPHVGNDHLTVVVAHVAS